MVLYGEEEYEPPPLVLWFHEFPHFDIHLSIVNNTFDQSNFIYKESLAILASVPVAILIINLFAFLIYFLTRCCQKDWKQKRSLTALKWTLAIMALFCCGAIGVGFYGNDETHVAVQQFTEATESIQSMVDSVQNQTYILENTLKNKVRSELQLMGNLFVRHSIENTTVLADLQQAVKNMQIDTDKGIDSIDNINSKIGNLGIKEIPKDVKMVEDFRWPITMASLCVFLVLCIVLFLGLIRHSRRILLIFSVVTLLVVIINWLLIAVYLASAVAFSDICSDPQPFIRQNVPTDLDKDILNYYMECNSGTDNPFSSKAFENVETTLNFVRLTATQYYPDTEILPILNDLDVSLNQTERIFSGMLALLNCQGVHHQYIVALNASCGPFINGIAFLLLSATSAGVLFLLMEWLSSNTWIYIRKKRTYVPVDEQDPFLPPSASANSCRGRETYGSVGYRPRHSHTPPQTPPFPSSQIFHCSNGRIPRIGEEVYHGRYTPPPLYEQLTGGLAPTAPLDT